MLDTNEERAFAACEPDACGACGRMVGAGDACPCERRPERSDNPELAGWLLKVAEDMDVAAASLDSSAQEHHPGSTVEYMRRELVMQAKSIRVAVERFL